MFAEGGAVRRRARNLLVVIAALLGAASAALASVAANAATNSEVPWWPSWLPSMADNYLWWLTGSILAVAGSAWFGVWAQRRYEGVLSELVPAPQRREPWVVDRPAEVGRIV